jgi:hypothetical protein
LQATARRPGVWWPSDMGPGVVDARALLGANLDLGRDRESVEPPPDPRTRAAGTVASLVAETLGADAADDEAVDWHRFGPELAHLLLSRQLAEAGPQRETAAVVGVTERLAATVSNPRLCDGLGLGNGLTPEIGNEGGDERPARPSGLV